MKQKELLQKLGKPNIHAPILPCVVVVTEEAEWYFLHPSQVIEIEDCGEVWRVTLKEDKTLFIFGSVKFLDLPEQQ